MTIPNPTHYYNCDEASTAGGMLDSVTAGAVDLTSLTGTPAIIGGVDGNAWEFDAGEKVSQPSDNSSLVGGAAKDCTVAVWFKYQYGTTGIVGRLGGGGGEWRIFYTPNKIGCQFGSPFGYNIGSLGNAIDGVGEVAAYTAYQFLVFRMGGGGSPRYKHDLDGVNIGGEGTPYAFWNNGDTTNRLEVGAEVDPASDVKSAIDSIAIWTSEVGGGAYLSDADVLSLWNGGDGRFWTPGGGWGDGVGGNAQLVTTLIQRQSQQLLGGTWRC